MALLSWIDPKAAVVVYRSGSWFVGWDSCQFDCQGRQCDLASYAIALLISLGERGSLALLLMQRIAEQHKAFEKGKMWFSVIFRAVRCNF